MSDLYNRARRQGKQWYYHQLMEQALNEGKTVGIASLRDGKVVIDVRGAGVARDITPGKPLRLEKPDE